MVQKIIEYLFHYRGQLFLEIVAIADFRRQDDATSGMVSDETSIGTGQNGLGSRHQHYSFWNGLLVLISYPARLPFETSDDYTFVDLDYEERLDMSEWIVDVKNGRLSQKQSSNGTKGDGISNTTAEPLQRRGSVTESVVGTQKRRRRRETTSEESSTTPERDPPRDLPAGARLLVAATASPTLSPVPSAQVDLALQLRQTKAAMRNIEAQLREQQDLLYEARKDLRLGLRQKENDLSVEFQVKADEWEKQIFELKAQIERLVERNRLLENSHVGALAKAVVRTRSDSVESIEES